MSFFINFIHNSKVKRSFIILILLCIFILISAISYVDAVSNDISNSVFRLHVIANSDTDEDQNLKYKIRDKLLEYMNSISKNCSSKEEIIKVANSHKKEFHDIAKQVITENGYDYNVTIKIGNFDFPTKNYGDISFPAGNYDALRVEIGNASGQNWWCVMFPPLCFVDVSSGIVPDESKEIIQNSLTNEEYNIISNQNSPDIKFKFSLIEMVQNLKMANK